MITFWSVVWVAFIIIELLTYTFYWFALSIWAFTVAVYEYFAQDSGLNIAQVLIFAIVSSIIAYTFAKIFSAKKNQDVIQWLDIYIWQIHKIDLVHKDLKITLDWVQYIISSDDELQEWDNVKIIGRKGSLFIVEKVKNNEKSR